MPLASPTRGGSSPADLVQAPLMFAAERGAKPARRVISASKRTDIPAFYLPWLVERVADGIVRVPNPMFRNVADPDRHATVVSLDPDDVQAIVWWSKNYAVYLRPRFSDVFARYGRQYFHFTVNSRRDDLRWVEPDVPSEEAALAQLRDLARLRDPAMIAWRNDPLVFWRADGQDATTWDPDFFERMCRALTDVGITTCFTSLVDPYRKFEQRIKTFFPRIELRAPSIGEVDAIAREMADIATASGMRLNACAESSLAGRPGFVNGACIDGALLQGTTAAATDRKMKGREECGCTKHIDIGDYVSQECGYSCVYCYANPNHQRYGGR
jgi:hypothetical protein